MSNKIIDNAKDKMEKTISVLKEDLNTIRTGRANPKMLDKLEVDYYGQMTPIKQISAISAPDPRTLQIQPWDKNALKDIEKSILAADLGFNPTNDGDVIRISIPQLTEDRRKELCKIASKMGEESKVSVRNVRRDANDDIKKLEKTAEISEDEEKSLLDEIQELTDNMTKKIDEVIKAKEKDIKEI